MSGLTGRPNSQVNLLLDPAVAYRQRQNPLLANALMAPPPTLADAMDYNAPMVGNALSRAWTASQDPQTWVDAARQWSSAMVGGTTGPGGKAMKLPIRPASEDVGGVLSANFKYGRNLGPKTVPIDSLLGGVALDNPSQAARVADLKVKMSGPDGYISRPIVDTSGNVVEGQHRLEALRQMGAKTVPVHIIEDLAANVDSNGLEAAVKAAQPMHGDQRTQLVQMLLESVADEGTPGAVRSGYDPPQGYGAGWHAGLDYLEKK